MGQTIQSGNTSVTGGVAFAGYPIPATSQTVIFAKASTNHAAAGTPVLVRNVTGGKTFYLQWIDFWQTNNGAIPQYMKLYDDTTQVSEHIHEVIRNAANNAFAASYVRVTFPYPIKFSTSVKIDNTTAMGGVYAIAIGGWEQ